MILKAIRVLLGILCLLAATFLFVDFTGLAPQICGWLAKIQLVPALLSLNFIALAILLVLALVFGRIYCSVICPLGVMQDVIIWIRGKVGSKKSRKNRFRYHKALSWLRLTVFTLFVVLTVLGLTSILASSIAGLLDPYSAFGRIVSQLGSPLYDGINNILASYAEQHDSYAFYRVTTVISIPVLFVAIITLLIVGFMAWTQGRGYCNKICPVGTLLGCLSRYSLMKITINTSKCNSCGLCERNCKSRCIQSATHSIDYSRCVVCMNCISTCRHGAISYKFAPNAGKKCEKPDSEKQSKNPDAGRRTFLATAGFLTGALAAKAAEKTVDGGFTELKDKKAPQRRSHIVPAGALSQSNLASHCTACQLCVSSCPEGIIKPSTSLDRFMQPELDFTKGYCPTECTTCSQVCPTDAIRLLDEAKKSAVKIGTAVVNLTDCISAAVGTSCGNCARHCPTGAISMVESKDGNMMPVVTDWMCIGCGACEYHCPVGSVASMKQDSPAIHIEGFEIHHTN